MLQRRWQHISLQFSNQSRPMINNPLQKPPENDGDHSLLRAGGQVHKSYGLV